MKLCALQSKKCNFYLTILLSLYCIALIIFLLNRNSLIEERNPVLDLRKPPHLMTQLIIEYVKTIPHNEKDISDIMTSFPEDQYLIEVHKKWNTDVRVFERLCNDLMQAIAATVDQQSVFYKSTNIWKNVIFAIQSICKELPLKAKHKTYPWGNNWYQFSITFPRLLVFADYIHTYLFNEINGSLSHLMQNYVLVYISSPILSMGWNRDGPNSVMMAVPYIGAMISKGRFEEATHNTGIKYVESFMEFKEVIEGEGIYADGGYIFHTNMRAYGYINEVFQDYRLLASLLNIGNITLLENTQYILEHPTIPRHFVPLFSRGPSLESNMVGKLGFFSVDSVKVISVKIDNWLLTFFGQSSNLCFYEADKQNDGFAQYWVAARHILTAKTPDIIYPEFITYYPGVISFSNEKIILKSTKKTTETFLPKEAKCIIAKTNTAVAMRNDYTIEQLNIEVKELIVVTSIGYSTVLHITPIVETENAIKVTINSGKLMESSKDYKAFKFEDNLSYITLGRSVTITKVAGTKVQPDRKIDAVQCEPDKDNLVAYSTTTTPGSMFATSDKSPSVDEFETVDGYRVVYDGDYLFLEDHNEGVVSVGIFSETPLSVLVFEAEKIVEKYPMATPQTAVLSNDKFYDVSNYMRLYSIFNI